MPGAVIVGTGRALPARVVTNADLERRVDTSDEWIVARTGIHERRVVDGAGEATSDLAIAAARAALDRAGVAAADLDLIVVGTASPDHVLPSTACLVQAALGARRAAAFDLNAACAGFVYGLAVADQALAAGAAAHVLLIGADAYTRHLDWTDRTTCVLFGDGAGAVVLARGPGLLGTHLGADGTRADELIIPAGGTRRPVDAGVVEARLHKIRMNGAEVFRGAVEAMADGLVAAAARAGVAVGDLRFVFAHQANLRILRAVAARVGLPPERFWTNIARYGNTGAGSIPIALAEADANGDLRSGDVIGLTAAGAGLTWGAAIVRWGGEA